MGILLLSNLNLIDQSQWNKLINTINDTNDMKSLLLNILNNELRYKKIYIQILPLGNEFVIGNEHYCCIKWKKHNIYDIISWNKSSTLPTYLLEHSTRNDI